MTMDLKTIILYLCICTVCCYPSRPLNDRPNELAWQAWLLVDSQNNNHGETDRRITPKSVFIAPNLGDNGSLPDCAEGYRSDPMGRCIKFIKVDEAAHLDFLLQRLNEMFETNPSEEVEDEVKPTTGPLQLNIPLGGGIPMGEQDPEQEIIVVAPTNGNFESGEEEDKTEVKRTHQNKDKEMTATRKTITEITTTTTTTVEDETTTIPPTEVTTMPTTQKLETPTTSTSAPVAVPASADDLQALFFLVPMNKTNHVQNNRTPDDTQQSDTPIESSKTTSDVKTVVTELLPMDTERTESTDTDSTYNSTPVDGDMEPQADKVKGKPDLETTFSVEDATDAYRLGYVRFPNDRDTTTSQFPSSLETSQSQQYQISTDRNPITSTRNRPVVFPSSLQPNLHISTDYTLNNQNKETNNQEKLTSSEIENLFKEYMHQNPEVIALTTTDRQINRRRPVSEATYVDTDEIIAQPQIQRPQHYYPPFNHRNRDRNSEFWRPLNWRDDSQQKPLVLRYGRHQAPSSSASASSRLISAERSAENSRFLQLDDRAQFSDVYGRTRRRGNFR